MSNKIFKNKLQNKYILPYSVILLSISLILSYIEILFPLNVGYLGVKIGLANIITLISLQILDTKWTLFLNIIRLIIIGILFGNAVRFALSFAGFLLSFIVMVFLLNTLHFSIIGTSIFGAVFHNIGQILALAIIMKSKSVLSLIPIYVVIGIVSGLIIGILTQIILKKLEILHLNNN